jgi:hypothetical protein
VGKDIAGNFVIATAETGAGVGPVERRNCVSGVSVEMSSKASESAVGIILTMLSIRSMELARLALMYSAVTCAAARWVLTSWRPRSGP